MTPTSAVRQSSRRTAVRHLGFFGAGKVYDVKPGNKVSNMRYLIFFSILFCAGCSSVPKVGGLDLHIGKHEHGLWYDSDIKQYDPNGWGLKFSILYGKLVDPYCKPGKSPWNGDKPAFVLRSPFIIFPYISISLGEYGLSSLIRSGRRNI